MTTHPPHTGSRLRTVTACGASSGAAGGAYGGGRSGATATPAAATTVETRSSDLGTFLTDGSGRTFYLFAADRGGTSTCSGGCAAAWPPVTTTGSTTASGQAADGKLGTVARSDGSTQVTYGGHPLYYYAGDQTAGETNGEGSTGFGAQWWVVSPAGTPITGRQPAASAGQGARW